VQAETDTLTLRVWWCNKGHWLSAVISFDLSDHVKWRKRPEMLSVWFCTKAVGSKLQLFQSLSVKCLASILKKHVHFV